jgi:hypothetical protein
MADESQTGLEFLVALINGMGDTIDQMTDQITAFKETVITSMGGAGEAATAGSDVIQESMGEATTAVTESAEAMSAVTDSVEAVGAAMTETADSTTAATETMTSAMMAAEAAIVESAEADATALEMLGERFMMASESSETFQKSLNRAMKGAIEVFAGAELSKSFIDPAEQLQEAQTQLAIATGATKDQIDSMTESAERLSTATNMSTEEILGAQKALYSYIGSAAESPDVMKQVANYARATGTDIKNAADVIGSAMVDFPNKALTAGQAAQAMGDKFALMQNKFMPREMPGQAAARSIARTAGEAAKYNIVLDQALATAAALNQTGLGGRRGSGQQVSSLEDALLKVNPKTGIDAIQKAGFALAKTQDGLCVSLRVGEKKRPRSRTSI